MLAARPHVLIATPGRLADHIKSGTTMHLEHLQFLVLDEADRLFEECFGPVRAMLLDRVVSLIITAVAQDMEVIQNALPAKEDRQTLMFSATLTEVA